MGKLGLALAGGGSRGSYQAGVWRALTECGVVPDIITGTSVGALNGALMVQGDYEQACVLWRRLTAQDVANVDLTKAMQSPGPGRAVYTEFLHQAVLGGGVDITGLETLMRGVIDEERFFDSPIDYGLVTVEYPTFKPAVLTKSQIPRGQLCDYLIASASCFPAFPVKRIDDAQYIDGSFHDSLPVNVALDLGAERVIAVDLQSIGIRQRPRLGGDAVIYIRPTHSLGPFLLFEPDSANRNMALGYLDALRALGHAEGETITLGAGETETLRAALAGQITQVCALLGEGEGGFWGALFARLGRGAAPLESERFSRAVQQLAEWYELDVETLYTAHSFCYELLLRFNAEEPKESDAFAALLRAPDAPGAADAAPGGLLGLGHRRLTEQIFLRLRGLFYGQGAAGEIQRLAALLQSETAAAVLLLALKRHLAGEPA